MRTHHNLDSRIVLFFEEICSENSLKTQKTNYLITTDLPIPIVYVQRFMAPEVVSHEREVCRGRRCSRRSRGFVVVEVVSGCSG